MSIKFSAGVQTRSTSRTTSLSEPHRFQNHIASRTCITSRPASLPDLHHFQTRITSRPASLPDLHHFQTCITSRPSSLPDLHHFQNHITSSTMRKRKSRVQGASVVPERPMMESQTTPENYQFPVLNDFPLNPDADPIGSVCRPAETKAGPQENSRTRRRKRRTVQMEENVTPTAKDLGGAQEQMAEGGQDINAVDGELCDLQVKYEKVTMALDELQKKQAELELESRSKEEQIAALHQSLHSQTERQEKILQEHKEEVTRLNDLLEKKELELTKANRRARKHRETLYELDDTKLALQAVRDEHLTCEEQKRLLMEDMERQREKAINREEQLMEMLTQIQEVFTRQLAEQKEKMEKQLVEEKEKVEKQLAKQKEHTVDVRQEVQTEGEVQSFKHNGVLPQELQKKKSRGRRGRRASSIKDPSDRDPRHPGSSKTKVLFFLDV
ncbi:tropomyosin-like [Antennarius striatus]|uniref:tropomyosin-like n=1 Tax=Antennarius striatus TaxID=241820 RepID=UPI0035B4B675